MNPLPPDDDESFAEQLRRQPLASLPAAWRAEILARAEAPAAPRPARSWPLADALRAWFRPHPVAYAGLLAAWAVILVLRWLTPSAPPPLPADRSPSFAALAPDPAPGEGPRFAVQTRVFSRSLPEEGQP